MHQRVENRNTKTVATIRIDTYMIFVNTSLDTAIERNNQRFGKLPLDIVKTYWNNVQSNIGKFQNLFVVKILSLLIIIMQKKMYSTEYSNQLKLATKKVNNYIAKQWIDNQLRMKIVKGLTN